MGWRRSKPGRSPGPWHGLRDGRRIAPGQAAAEAADDFIGDGLCPVGQVKGGDLRLSLPAQQDNLIPYGDVRITCVDNQLVHANASDDGHAASSNQDVGAVGQPTVITVGITDRNDAESRWPRSNVRGPVADFPSCRYAAHLHDLGLDGEG